MTTRFEVRKNGERVCIAGLAGEGVLSVSINYVKHPGHDGGYRVHVGGLGAFDPSQRRQVHADWPAPIVAPGDEITVRVLPPGAFDDPVGIVAQPTETREDPDFGTLQRHNDAWHSTLGFDSPPIATARIRVLAGDSGPSAAQRLLLRDLVRRHGEVWPEICAALVRCHSKIGSSEELLSRVSPVLFVEIGDDPDVIELSYALEGDPDDPSCVIRLRAWAIAEVFMVA
jgi:hypothetical protein